MISIVYMSAKPFQIIHIPIKSSCQCKNPPSCTCVTIADMVMRYGIVGYREVDLPLDKTNPKRWTTEEIMKMKLQLIKF
jgi:hypothetical protein